MLTQKEVKDFIYYNPKTGYVTLLKPTTTHQKEGQIVGLKGYINIYRKTYGTLSLISLYLFGDYKKKLITLDGSKNLRRDNLFEVGSLTFRDINQDTLKNFLSYDEVTGVFTWKKRYTSNVEVGTIAGSLTKAGYRVITFLGKNIPAHRLVWLYVYGKFPDKVIDHIDQNKDNNKLSNLRNVHTHVNNKNKSLYYTNQTGYHDVSKHGDNWKARIGVNGTKVLLGVFPTFEEAVAAKKAGEKLLEYHNNHGNNKSVETIP